MAQGPDRLHLPLEAGDEILRMAVLRREDLDGKGSLQPLVLGLVGTPHRAAAERLEQQVVVERIGQLGGPVH